MRKMDISPVEGHRFSFTRNWFLNRNLASFRKHVHPGWQGRPITYLELGVFEGMSLVWMMQHILYGPDSQAVGIDPWLMTTKLDGACMEEVMKRAAHNLEPWSDRCTLIRGNSAEVLRRMTSRKGYCGIAKNSVDLCMIDGNHHALAVLDDLRLVHRLMRPGGQIILDDIENDKEKKDHAKQGLAMWLEEAGDKVERVWKHRYCECWRKVR